MKEDELSLREMEEEVLAEGREWMRRRLEEKLQAQADRLGRVFPPKPTARPSCASASDVPAHGQRAD